MKAIRNDDSYTIIEHKNGYSARYKNRKISAVTYGCKVIIQLLSAVPNIEDYHESENVTIRKNVVCTKICLSTQASIALSAVLDYLIFKKIDSEQNIQQHTKGL